MNGKTHTYYFITITNYNQLFNLSEILHAFEEALTERIQDWFCILALLSLGKSSVAALDRKIITTKYRFLKIRMQI